MSLLNQEQNPRLPLLLVFAAIFSVLHPTSIIAQTRWASWTDSSLVLDNGAIKRLIRLPREEGPFLTVYYQPEQGAFPFFEKTSPDFSFTFNDKVYSGNGQWRLSRIDTLTDTREGNGAAVTLLSTDGHLQVTIGYLLYPGLPLIRKQLAVKNLTGAPANLESVDVEYLTFTIFNPNCYSWVFGDYGRRRSLGAFDGGKQDALVSIFNPEWKAGILVGNEAPGVVKHTSVFWEAPEIRSGLSHKNALFPFRKWLDPGATFKTPPVFTILFNQEKDTRNSANTTLSAFISKHMGIRLTALKTKPSFVYNTWRPFQTEINEDLVKELAKAAAAAGMKEFVIDDGWEDNIGDWGIDYKKFPHGLKPVFDYIKSLGMKPGLWISVGTASPDSKVWLAHPDWFVRDSSDKPTSLILENYPKYTACFGTGWYDYIKGVLNKLVLEYGLEYMKLDFSVVAGPYRYDHTASGCYAKGHPGHRDQHESLFTNYTGLWNLFDELHTAKPSLFIDCTFETMGGLQLIDYAMLKHAEGNWLSNFYEPGQDGDLRIREMAWWRSPAMPATALVIGNLAMDDKGWELHIKSLAGALPILLGDPRKLKGPELKKYRAYADWLSEMDHKHAFLSYRQDLAGFGEPAEGCWDGFQRINTLTRSGGLAAIFRHGSTESKRQVTVHYLDPDASYRVTEAITGLVIKESISGRQLAETGFELAIKELYGGRLLGLEKIPGIKKIPGTQKIPGAQKIPGPPQ